MLAPRRAGIRLRVARTIADLAGATWLAVFATFFPVGGVVEKALRGLDFHLGVGFIALQAYACIIADRV